MRSLSAPHPPDLHESVPARPPKIVKHQILRIRFIDNFVGGRGRGAEPEPALHPIGKGPGKSLQPTKTSIDEGPSIIANKGRFPFVERTASWEKC